MTQPSQSCFSCSPRHFLDPLALQRSKSLARIIKYLQSINEAGSFYEAREIDDIAVLLDTPPQSLGDSRRAIADAVRGGRVDDRAYLTYAWRRTARDNELMRTASGALADRHWPPLR